MYFEKRDLESESESESNNEENIRLKNLRNGRYLPSNNYEANTRKTIEEEPVIYIGEEKFIRLGFWPGNFANLGGFSLCFFLSFLGRVDASFPFAVELPSQF